MIQCNAKQNEQMYARTRTQLCTELVNNDVHLTDSAKQYFPSHNY